MGVHSTILKLAASLLPAAVLAITPEQLISAPRRSTLSPNADGTLGLYSVASYSFETHETSSSWQLLDLSSGESTEVLDSDVNEVVWLSGTTVLYVNGTGDVPGGVSLWVADISDSSSGYSVGSIPAPLANLKAIVTPTGDVTFLLSGLAYPNGTAYNEELVTPPVSSARIYDDIYVRHWDVWLSPQKYNLFSGFLTGGSNSSYTFDGTITNLLGGIKGLETPVQPFGDSGDFVLTPDGDNAIFLSKDPDLTYANYTASYLFLVPTDGSAKPVAINGPGKAPAGVEGATSAPSLSRDGTKLAYFQMDGIDYESDRRKTYIASGNFSTITPVAEDWDRSPFSIVWSEDDSVLYALTEDVGLERIYTIPVNATSAFIPEDTVGLTEVSISAFSLLPSGDLLLSWTSLTSSTAFTIVSADNSTTTTLLDPVTTDPELADLANTIVEDFYYYGAWTSNHAWVVKPSFYQPNQTYPLAFLVHGGPQGAWFNSWSTRWNPAVFADQGYIVVLPNPTGSTSYGQELTDKIQNNWGGDPYEDLVLAWEYVRDNLDDVDTDNGVAAGASYGGYMMNWIQGHPLGREFKAQVTHDGSFSTWGQIATEELWFIQHDFNGTLWDEPDNYFRWDPSRFSGNFSTPHLLIHNSLDYRLPESEGLAMFNALQELGVPSRFLNFPDENHWVLNRENSLVWHQQVLGWLNKYSGITEDIELVGKRR